MNTKRISLNLIGQIFSFVCSLAISFFITPYVVANLGSEAYGFVGLANNFTSYITLFTVALNGMLSRYITVEYSKRNYEKASGYFSTAVITQLILALALLIPMMLLANHMDVFVNVSNNLVPDVKLLWTLIFIAFLINVGTEGWGSSAFAADRLDIKAVVTVCSNVIKSVTMLLLFLFYPPHVWYIGFANIAANIVILIGNFWCKKNLIPEVKLSIKYFNKKYIYSLLIVGIWNSINKLQQVLQTGLDLLLANLFVSANDMGLLSVAKTVPTQISALISTTSGAFEPGMTITYGKGDIKQFVKETKFAMKLCGFLCSVPILGFVCFGVNFYNLWLPSYTDAEIIKVQILAVLTLLPQVFSVYVFPLYSVNNITCKLKIPVLLSLGINIANIIIVFVLLKTTNLGVYAIAGVSSILWIFRVILFVPSYAAWSLNINLKTFYPPLLRGFLNIVVLLFVFSGIAVLFYGNSWIKFAIICLVTGFVGYVISFFILLNKEEQKKAFTLVLKRLKKV